MRPSASSSTFLERVRLGGEPVERELRASATSSRRSALATWRRRLEKIKLLEDLVDIARAGSTSASRARASSPRRRGDLARAPRPARRKSSNPRRPSRPARRVFGAPARTLCRGARRTIFQQALCRFSAPGEHVAATTRLGASPQARCKSRRAARRARTRLSSTCVASAAGGAGRVNASLRPTAL